MTCAYIKQNNKWPQVSVNQELHLAHSQRYNVSKEEHHLVGSSVVDHLHYSVGLETAKL